VKKLLLLALVVACLAPLACKKKDWRVRLWVGPGEVETTPDGSRVAVLVAITDPDGHYPDTALSVKVTNRNDGVYTTVAIPANRGYWMGWLYYTDGRVWPTSEIEASAEVPGGGSVNERQDHTSGGTTLSGPPMDLAVDTTGGRAVITIGTVDDGESYRCWLSRGDAPFDIAWGSDFHRTAFTDTVPLDTLASGEAYYVWALANDFDMTAVKAGPAALDHVGSSVRSSLGRGPQFTNPLSLGRAAQPPTRHAAAPGALVAQPAD
jgi:hypothetical protein